MRLMLNGVIAPVKTGTTEWNLWSADQFVAACAAREWVGEWAREEGRECVSE